MLTVTSMVRKFIDATYRCTHRGKIKKAQSVVVARELVSNDPLRKPEPTQAEDQMR